jgi:hypothetical protein
MTNHQKQDLKSNRSNHCPACSVDSNVERSFAVVSPWVLEISKECGTIITKYMICASCNTGWFDISYSDHVLASLYKAYRGENYFKTRNSWEPTYTKSLNSNLNNGPKWLQGRTRQILNALEDAGSEPSNMKSVLDFGGGHGGVMPKFASRYLLEANEAVTPESGVQLIRTVDDAKNLDLDLIMCCGVLEHLNNPTDLVKTIMGIDSKTYIFEVPTGTPMVRSGFASSKTILKLIASNKLLWRTVQRAERRAGRRWRKWFPLRCSEHLQFFSSEGLRLLLENCDLEVLNISETKPNEALSDEKNLGFEVGLIAVCQKKSKTW